MLPLKMSRCLANAAHPAVTTSESTYVGFCLWCCISVPGSYKYSEQIFCLRFTYVTHSAYNLWLECSLYCGENTYLVSLKSWKMMPITHKLYIKYIFLVKMSTINILNLFHYPVGIHQLLYCNSLS